MRLGLLLLLSTTLGVTTLSAEDPFGSPAKPVSDVQLKAMFSGKMTKLKKEEETADVEMIAEQLRQRKRVEEPVKLPSEPSLPDESNKFRQAKAGSLLFGNLYLCGKCDKWHSSIAGGVVISPGGLAVTNYHVLDNEKAIAFGAMTPDGVVHPVKEVLAASKDRDVALVQLAGENFTYALLSDDLAVGDDLFVVSHPNGRFFSFSEGVVSRYASHPKGGRAIGKLPVFMEITADFAKGSSGSGVFSREGQLAGLVASTNSIYYSKEDGIDKNLQMVVKSCVPVSAIRELIRPPASAAVSEK